MLACALFGCSRAPDEAATNGNLTQKLADLIATCASATGKVEVMRAGHAYWEPLEAGATFRSGDWVRTGPLATARIEFLGGGRIELDERSVVLVEQPAASDAGVAAGALVAIESGGLRGVVPATRESEPAAIVVRTQEGALVALRSEEKGQPAEFRFMRTEQGPEIAVTRGRLALTSGKRSRTLESGRALELAKGVDAPAYALPDFPPSLEPGVDARFQWAEGLRIQLAWGPMNEVHHYRVQVARDLGFTQLVASSVVAEPSLSFTPSEPGMFTWRVASRDDAGHLGEYGFARRIYVDKEGPEQFLVAPSDGHEAIAGDPAGIVFAWQSMGGRPSYRLVIARDAKLSDVVFTQLGTAQQMKVSRLAVGEYYWGAYVDTEPPVPLFQKPRKLVVLKPRKARLQAPRAIDRWGN
ncbi:hypothetical protein JY651_26230 [Pyxidicoccus parkwayensis]|uniref:FecR protein domain-containing protein n=1 Tax=Pyxidicoccus parkwayensis TaxID=2813578 RepID=A0ABX7NJN6_9BACT|nr:hypothetical protein [Pyxidicoccus parkwaysis]QSQ18858.1 hypothetical protein JY651_26230 [Pyxidicoccus parkwaysis]